MFDLVADVACYPEFLPFVSAARVREDDGTVMLADLVVGYGPFRETYTSRVEKQRPESIHVTAVSGPLKQLANDWRFVPSPSGTELAFSVQFAFRSRLLDIAAARAFPRVVRAFTDAFEARARQVYGAGEGISSSSAHSAA